jgi:hypothetical protein
MIKIDDRDYTISEIQQIFDLCRELLQTNSDLNAKMIAMNAKLENEEKKVKELQYRLWLLQMDTINKYEA